jgi:hypothetical protein
MEQWNAATIKIHMVSDNSDLVILFEKMAVNLCTSRNCMKIGHGSNSGIQGLRNLGIEGILSLLIY